MPPRPLAQREVLPSRIVLMSAPRLWAKARHRSGAIHSTGRLRAIEIAKRLAVEQRPTVPRRGLPANDGAVGLALPLVIGSRTRSSQ